MKSKRCSGCNKRLNINMFYTHTSQCRECEVNRVRINRGKLKKLGLCIDSCGRRSKAGVTRCLICTNKSVKRYHKLVKLKLCVKDCGRKSAGTKKKCNICNWYCILRDCKIPINIASNKIERQNYLCPLSGRRLVPGLNCSPDHIKHKYLNSTNSLSNIRFVNTHVNFARNVYSDKEFIQMCKDVYLYQKKLGNI